MVVCLTMGILAAIIGDVSLFHHQLFKLATRLVSRCTHKICNVYDKQRHLQTTLLKIFHEKSLRWLHFSCVRGALSMPDYIVVLNEHGSCGISKLKFLCSCVESFSLDSRVGTSYSMACWFSIWRDASWKDHRWEQHTLGQRKEAQTRSRIMMIVHLHKKWRVSSKLHSSEDFATSKRTGSDDTNGDVCIIFSNGFCSGSSFAKEFSKHGVVVA